MEGEKRKSMTLPEDLGKSILAMVSFPCIFKSRALSKSWLVRFSLISSQDDEDEKSVVALFQEQVGEWSSTNWKTFCPIFFGQQDFLAYDRASNHWQRMPWLSFMPKNLFSGLYCWRLEGARLLVSEQPLKCRFFKNTNFYVANILTRSWKKLPPRLICNTEGNRHEDILIHMLSPHVYKFADVRV